MAAQQRELPDGRVELVDTKAIEESPLYNRDLAPVPVAQRRWTTWVDPDGTIEFRNDVYGHDMRLDQALRSGVVAQFEVNPQPAQESTGP